jgi:hypothetical protein
VAALLAEGGATLRNPSLTSGDAGPLLRSLTSWDGWWYVEVARAGYHVAPIGAIVGGYHDYAFLPFYPLLVGFVSLPWPALAGLLGVVITNVAFLVALVLLYQLGRRHFSYRTALAAPVLLAISPFGAVFAMAYSESLFLALVLGAFLSAELGRRRLAALLLLLAGLTRVQAVVLALPLWLLMLRQDRQLRPSQLLALAGPLGTFAFIAFVAWFTGSPTAFFDNLALWGRSGASLAPAGGPAAGAHLTATTIVLLAALVAPLFPLVYARVDRLPVEYALIPLLIVGLEFASGWLPSVGRYMSVAFPLFWLIGNRRGTGWRIGWPVLSAALLGVFALLMFAGFWVP